MTAITPLTTGFHEITPLTMKTERCYNHPTYYLSFLDPCSRHERMNFKNFQLSLCTAAVLIQTV